MRNLILLLCIPIAHLANAQYTYTITSVPDSAEVKMNGTTLGFTPYRVNYYWYQAQFGRMAFEVCAPGYTSWTDTLFSKPSQLDKAAHVLLQRKMTDYDVRSTTAIVAFDRLLADLEDGRVIGRTTDKFGATVPLKWEGYTKLGSQEFRSVFTEQLQRAGFATGLKEATKLFSDQSNERPKLPRFVVGVQLIDYIVDVRFSKKKHYGAGSVLCRVHMKLEWQVLDKQSDDVVLRDTTDGTSLTRQGTTGNIGNNLAAFEAAMVTFLDHGGLVGLVKEASNTSISEVLPLGATDPLLTIARPELPAFNTLAEMIKHADRSCVTVITDGGHGSGVIISSSGLVLSANHVIEGVNSIEVQFSDGLRQAAHVVRSDEATDLVLLDIDGSGFKPLPMGNSDAASLGDEVITIGTPAELDLGQSISKGIVSGRRNHEGQVYLQTDVAVSPGNSGGPLLDMQGRIIGIVQRKLIAEGVEGIGFAMPINNVIKALRLSAAE